MIFKLTRVMVLFRSSSFFLAVVSTTILDCARFHENSARSCVVQDGSIQECQERMPPRIFCSYIGESSTEHDLGTTRFYFFSITVITQIEAFCSELSICKVK